jgi:hypothetical protein
VEVTVDQSVRGRGDDHAAGRCDLLEPGGDVGRVADRRVVHPQVGANRPDHDEAGVEPLPDLEGDAAPPLQVVAQLVQPPLDAERGVGGPLGMLFVRDRGAEERHDAVAEELVHRALVAVDLVQHQLERLVHQHVGVLGVELRGQRREARDVGEQDRHLLALSLERASGREDLVGEVPRRVRLGRAEAGRLGRRGHRMRALRAEPGAGGHRSAALAAG